VNSAVLVNQALQKNDWPLTQAYGLPLLQSPLLAGIDSLVHAFTTRIGGESDEPLDSFNLGRHWNTEESRIDAIKNRERLCAALGLDAERLTVPGQQHTTNIYVVETQTASHSQRLPELDGAASDQPGYPVLLHFADCVPIMLYDRRNKVLCVLHAGWKGTAGGIASKGVQLLQQRWDSDPHDIAAAIGPAIGSCCYPTGDDVAAKLSETITESLPLMQMRNGKLHPDLKAINAMQLLECQVRDIDVSAWCTACHPEIFYSHRQSSGKTGRQGAIACIKPG
jgi:polyphenol oxidase